MQLGIVYHLWHTSIISVNPQKYLLLNASIYLFIYETGSLCVAQASPTFTSCLSLQGTGWATMPTIRICIYQWWNKVQWSQVPCPKLSTQPPGSILLPHSQLPAPREHFSTLRREHHSQSCLRVRQWCCFPVGFNFFKKIFSFLNLTAYGATFACAVSRFSLQFFPKR